MMEGTNWPAALFVSLCLTLGPVAYGVLRIVRLRKDVFMEYSKMLPFP